MRNRIQRFVVLATVLASLTAVTSSPALAEITCDEPSASNPSSPSASATPVASPAAAAFPEEGGEMTVFAAASLTDAFAEVKGNLEAANPGLSITIETGGSQALVTQLEQGATVDVLATANTSTMHTAVDDGLVAHPSELTTNRLVIVTPQGNDVGITSLDDLAGDGVKFVVAAPDVPAGDYATRAICAYDVSGSAPDGFLDAINGNIVSEEPDVRSVLAKVQLGEADAGIVYASDAAASNAQGNPVDTIDFPAGIPVNATYMIGAVEGGNPDLAAAFIGYVLGPEGQEILANYGFGG